MFDNKVDITKTYGATVVKKAKIKAITPKPIKSVDKKLNKNKRTTYINSTVTYKEYQELRKTDKFKRWWRRQFAYQDGLCYYCKVDLKKVSINVEHITPMSAGGSNKYRNLVLSCSKCNKEKGSSILPNKIRKKLKLELYEKIKLKKAQYNTLVNLTNEELEIELFWRNNL